MVDTVDPLDVFMTFHEGGKPPPPPPRSLTVRMPLDLFAYLEEMAEAANVSLNTMALHLMGWGIDSGLERLPPDLADEIRTDAAERARKAGA